MKARLWISALLAGLLLSLAGCMSQGVDELFAVPRTSEAYQKLQEAIKAEIGNADGIVPASGSNTQSIQLVDLDQDGIEEAITFYRDNSAERPSKIAIFRQDREGEYFRYALIEGAATDIESIEYCDLGGNGDLEIIVSWQVSPTIHTLIAYSVQTPDVTELMRSTYTRYLTMDLDADGAMEILLVHIDSSEPAQNRVELYVSADEAMELNSFAPLSEGISGSPQTYETGTLVGEVPALFVTSDYGDGYYLTDIFTLVEGDLRNITLNETERRSTSTYRYYTNVALTDINGDKVTEVPIPKRIPSYQSTGADNFFEIIWKQFDVNGNAYPTITTYHNNSDRWYLELPEHWKGVITLNRKENAAIGERAVVFSHWVEGADAAPVPFLTIYRLSGNNRGVNADSGGREILWSDTELIYAAEFTPGGWDCGLDIASLSERFHTTTQ